MRNRKLIIGIAVFTLALMLAGPPTLRLFRSMNTVISEEGPELVGQDVRHILDLEIGTANELPVGIEGLHGRRDPRDGTPTWAVYNITQEDFERLKTTLIKEYSNRKNGGPFVIDDSDQAPNGGPPEAMLLTNC